MMEKLQEVVSRYKALQQKYQSTKKAQGGPTAGGEHPSGAGSEVVQQLQEDKKKLMAKLQEVVGRYRCVSLRYLKQTS